MTTSQPLVAYRVWDAPTRWFHWINALAVLGLIVVGTVVLFDDSLGMSGPGKVTAKTIHVWIGYVLIVNLLWRFVWAFFGNRYARWKAILPGGPGYIAAAQAYVSAFLAGEPKHYLGHNPIGRIAVLVILVLLVIQAATGSCSGGNGHILPALRELGRALGRRSQYRSLRSYAVGAGSYGQERLRGHAVVPGAVRGDPRIRFLFAYRSGCPARRCGGRDRTSRGRRACLRYVYRSKDYSGASRRPLRTEHELMEEVVVFRKITAILLALGCCFAARR